MKLFLGSFMKSNQDLEKYSAVICKDTFGKTISAIHRYLGERAFKPVKAFNAAVFDSVMVGVSYRLDQGAITSSTAFVEAYEALLQNLAYQEAYSRATSNDESVKNRLRISQAAFNAVR